MLIKGLFMVISLMLFFFRVIFVIKCLNLLKLLILIWIFFFIIGECLIVLLVFILRYIYCIFFVRFCMYRNLRIGFWVIKICNFSKICLLVCKCESK